MGMKIMLQDGAARVYRSEKLEITQFSITRDLTNYDTCK